jgi:hypothetical protein
VGHRVTIFFQEDRPVFNFRRFQISGDVKIGTFI